VLARGRRVRHPQRALDVPFSAWEREMKRIAAAIVLCIAVAACAERTDETALPADSAGVPADTNAMQAPGTQTALVNPETATREQLLQVDGIDEAAADAIIAGRPYNDMLAVDSVLATSLSEEQRRDAYRTLWKPIDLNTASREEILLIPDVDPRMPHEFDEYRPYTDMEQFRREIGKYVDAAEVARYERYVEIRS
jgi:DNA uptake protein ComE-like DNA-binding protein